MLLQKAFELIYIKGFQATSLDEILATTNVTKGAFYYHFKNKEEMGLALINEWMGQSMAAKMMAQLDDADDPLEAIYETMRALLFDHPLLQARYGCPTHNLIQEMAPLHPKFKDALLRLIEDMQHNLATVLENAKKKGIMKKDVDTRLVTNFITTGYAGVRNIGKLYENNETYELYLKTLKAYFDGLRS